MNRDDLLNSIDGDLANLTVKKKKNQRLREFGSNSFKGCLFTILIGAGIQFGTNMIYDPEPYNDAKDQMEAGTLIVPKSAYIDYQEKCIRHYAEESESLNLEDRKQSEVIGLLEDRKYKDVFAKCADQEYTNALITQREYVDSLAKSSVGSTLVAGGIVGSLFYLGIMGFGARSMSGAQKKIQKRERDRDLLNFD